MISCEKEIASVPATPRDDTVSHCSEIFSSKDAPPIDMKH